MLRKLIPFVLVGSLAGCAGSVGLIPILGPVINALVTIPVVQQATKSLCGFVPIAEDVAALFGANPAVATAEAFANMICSGLVTSNVAGRRTARRSASGGAVSHVGAITVRGSFVN